MAAGKAHALLVSLLEGLEVCADRMRANLETSGGYPLSEGVMLALARHVGKQVARRVVQQLAALARHEGRSFVAAIAGDPEICAHLTKQELNLLFTVDEQIGQCQALVDRVLRMQPGSSAQ